MWNLAWRSNETKHREIHVSQRRVSKVVRVETACGLLPCVGLVSLNLGEVTTDELRRLRNISCSLDFLKRHVGDEKKDVITYDKKNMMQNRTALTDFFTNHLSEAAAW